MWSRFASQVRSAAEQQRVAFKEIRLPRCPAAPDTMAITRDDQISMYGLDDTEALLRFLRDATSGVDADALAQYILAVALCTALATGFDSAYVIVRTDTGSRLWKTPRWHIDYTYFGRPGSKLVAVLTGPGTLFKHVDDGLRASFFATRDPLERARNRRVVDRLLSAVPTQAVRPGHGVLYRYGDPGTAAVHSEPFLDRGRLFVSVVPGTDAEVRARRDAFSSSTPTRTRGR